MRMDATGLFAIDRNDVEFNEKIGRGGFGKVYKVKLKIRNENRTKPNQIKPSKLGSMERSNSCNQKTYFQGIFGTSNQRFEKRSKYSFPIKVRIQIESNRIKSKPIQTNPNQTISIQ